MRLWDDSELDSREKHEAPSLTCDVTQMYRKGRWRSWLSHLSNTQKVLSSILGRLTFCLRSRGAFLRFVPFRTNTYVQSSILRGTMEKVWYYYICGRGSAAH